MTALTIAWLLFPLLAGFLAALLPALVRPSLLLACLFSGAMALATQQGWVASSLQLLGPLGITLQPDGLAAPFLLLNALVCAAVVLDGWRRPKGTPALLLILVLHGAINSTIVAADLISIYVALEVVSICTFLLLLEGGEHQQVWLGLRTMLISNTVMLLYLIGCGLIYLQLRSFALAGVSQASGTALVLLLVALLTKAEVFVAGLWLPRTNAEGPLEVSALLSGTVVSAGVVPLLRITGDAGTLLPLLRWLGIGCAAAGVLFALLETDARRLLAWSTLSQMGLVVILPAVGGIYALGHGLAKAALFLVARRVPATDLAGWRERPLPAAIWWPLMVASLSIAGLPPLLGFLAKEELSSMLPTPTGWMVTVLGAGTVAVYARLWTPLPQRVVAVGATGGAADKGLDSAAGPGVGLLIAALLVLTASPWAQAAWRASSGTAVSWVMLKSGVTFTAGLMLHRLLNTRPSGWVLPSIEGLDDLLGAIVLLGAGLLATLLVLP